MNSVVSMRDPTSMDIRRVGAKAARLASLARQGYDVPPFFVIGAEVFAGVRADPRLRELDRAIAADGVGGRDAAEAASRVLAAPIDPRVWPRVLELRRVIGAGPVAVRSSAIVEDGAAHSFAGQLDSVLGVRDDDALARAVRAVWASVYGARAVAYRRLRDVPRSLDVAVIVQRQVEADRAGVSFSVDPTDACLLAISATRGLGDALVAGRTPGETYRVDRETLATTGPLADGAILSERELRDLATLALRLERDAGCPQDVEWAIANGRIHVLQARAITTAPARRTTWDNANIVESFPGLTLPLTYSLARACYAAVYRQAAALAGVSQDALDAHDDDLQLMIGLIRGRVYYRLDSWYAMLSLLPGVSHNRRFMEQMMGVRTSLRSGRVHTRPSPSEVVRIARLSARMAILGLSLGGRVRAFARMIDEICGEHERHDLRALDADALVARYETLTRTIRDRWQAPIMNDFSTALMFGLARLLLGRWGRGAASLEDLLRGIEMPSVVPAREMAAIAATVRADEGLRALFRERTDDELASELVAGRLPRPLERAVSGYLDRFGYRCVQELKLERPSLRDDAAPLFAGIRAYIDRPDVDLLRSAERDRAARHAAERRLHERLGGVLGSASPRLVALRWIVGRARRHMRDREEMRFARGRVFGLARELFTAMGLRLAEAHRIDDGRDIFYLTVEEACAAARGDGTADLRSLVRARRLEYDRYESEPPLPDRFETSGDPSAAAESLVTSGADEAPGDALQGTPCCAGVVRGIARVVAAPSRHELRAGEVLVARETDPGWVTVFPLAAGILIERGSPLSHSAIVARELGIPTIVGIRGLTREITTGALLTMDGATGRVTRVV